MQRTCVLLLVACALAAWPLQVAGQLTCPRNSYIEFINGVPLCSLCFIPPYSAGGDPYYCSYACNAGYFLSTVNHNSDCLPCGPHSSSPGVDALTCTCDTADGFQPNGFNANGSPICYCPADSFKVTPTSCIACPVHSILTAQLDRLHLRHGQRLSAERRQPERLTHLLLPRQPLQADAHLLRDLPSQLVLTRVLIYLHLPRRLHSCHGQRSGAVVCGVRCASVMCKCTW